MPLPLGHSAIGIATHSLITEEKSYRCKWKTTLFVIILSNLPDVDIILGLLLENNGSAFHRGPTHSILFALIFGFLFSRATQIRSLPHMGFKTCFTLILSHVVADHFLTDSQVSFFWPFEVYYSTENTSLTQVLYSVLFDAVNDAVAVFICALILLINFSVRTSFYRSRSELE